MKRRVMIVALMALLFTFQIIHPSRLMAQQPKALLTITPDCIDTRMGQHFTVTLEALDVSDLYGFQLELDYARDVLQVEDVTLIPQSEFSELTRDIDNDAGKVTLVATMTGDNKGLSGKVALLEVKFKVIGRNSAVISLKNVKLSNSWAEAIPYETASSTVNNDNSPPSLQAVEVRDNNTLEVVFDEPVNYHDNLNPDNFSIVFNKPGLSGSLDIEDIKFGSSNSIILTTAPHTGARIYRLEVKNIRDGLYNIQNTPQAMDFIGQPRVEIRVEDQPYSKNKFYITVNLGDLDNFKQAMFIMPFDGEKMEFCERHGLDDPLKGNIGYPVTGKIVNNPGKENTHQEVRFNARIEIGVSPMDVVDATIARFSFKAKDPWEDLTLEFENMILICTHPDGSEIVFNTHPDSQQSDRPIKPKALSFSILKGYALSTDIDCQGGMPYLTLKWLGSPKYSREVFKEGVNIQVADLMPGDYQLSITNPGYLAYNQQIKITDDLNLKIRLAAGDVDGNDIIDIFDLMLIAKNINISEGDGKYSLALDLNRDGVIDIYDVVLAAKNFGVGAE